MCIKEEPNSDLVWDKEECVSGSKRRDVRRLFLREEHEHIIAMQQGEECSMKKTGMS